MKKSLLNSLFMTLGFLVLFSSCNSVSKKTNHQCFTESPIVLPEGTDGSFGPEGTYVLFGDWPQTLKAMDVTVSSVKEDINGWECYKGSDGFYYVKAEADPYYNPWYDLDYNFSNGETIKKGESYYFKLEPIKWRVITDDYQDGKLLLAENVLTNGLYDTHADKYDLDSECLERIVNGKTVYSNNYKYSTVRAYLNGLNGSAYDVEDFTGKGFINRAFTKVATEKINTVILDNSAKSTGKSDNKYACENSEDKIFLLSSEEVSNSEYGFTMDEAGIQSKKRKVTDYSIATGSLFVTDNSSDNNGWWWLRSPFYIHNNCSDFVYYGGGAGIAFYYIFHSEYGIVPALTVSF